MKLWKICPNFRINRIVCRQVTELQIEYDNWPRIVTKIDGVNKASMPFLHFRPIKLHLGSVWGPAMIKSESIYGLIYSCLMIIQLLLLLKLLLLFTKVKGIQITCESMAFQWEQEIWFSIAVVVISVVAHHRLQKLFALHPTIYQSFWSMAQKTYWAFQTWILVVTLEIENVWKVNWFHSKILVQYIIEMHLVHNKCT